MDHYGVFFFFFSSRRRHTRSLRDWSSDVCSSDLLPAYERDHPERSRPVEERRGDPGAEAELAELALLGVARVGHVLAVDRLAGAKDLVEQRLAHRLARAAGVDHLGADP